VKSRALVLIAALSLSVVAQAGSTYLALGDSLSYGLTPDATGLFGYNAPSDGNRYYVANVANAVGTLEGSAPTVIDLAIPGETSKSFGDVSNLFRGANTSYGANVFLPRQISQFDFAQEKIAALGSSIHTVSFALGANDFLALSGDLQADPTAVQNAFLSIGGRYATFLTTLRTELPNARLILPGYYNPYLATDARHAPADGVIRQLNTLIQGYAVSFNGRYVDFYSPIEGHQDTLLAPGDIHPNEAGYAALGRVAAQAVPEPASIAALGLGSLALLRRVSSKRGRRSK